MLSLTSSSLNLRNLGGVWRKVTFPEEDFGRECTGQTSSQGALQRLMTEGELPACCRQKSTAFSGGDWSRWWDAETFAGVWQAVWLASWDRSSTGLSWTKCPRGLPSSFPTFWSGAELTSTYKRRTFPDWDMTSTVRRMEKQNWSKRFVGLVVLLLVVGLSLF